MENEKKRKTKKKQKRKTKKKQKRKEKRKEKGKEKKQGKENANWAKPSRPIPFEGCAAKLHFAATGGK